MRHRARALIEAVIGSADDPFRLAWLSREDHGALVAEAAAISMMPGRRVVCVRGRRGPAGARGGTGAGGTRGQSRDPRGGRAAGPVQTADASGAARGCRGDRLFTLRTAPRLRTVIDQELNAAGVTADRDAKALLMERLGADRAVTRAELQKLIPLCRCEWPIDGGGCGGVRWGSVGDIA